MSDQIILHLPEDISARAREIAEVTSQPIEQVLIEHLKSLSTSQRLPADVQSELDALAYLSDDALWTIAQEQMPREIQAQVEQLTRKQLTETISEPESELLTQLMERADRLMLRKAEAAVILQQRGKHFTQKDFKPTN